MPPGAGAGCDLDGDQENVYESVNVGASSMLYGVGGAAWRRAGAAPAAACRHAQTLEFNSRGARALPPGAGAAVTCTMPRTRADVRPPCLVLLRACSCHLLPESHRPEPRPHQGRGCCADSPAAPPPAPPAPPDGDSDSDSDVSEWRPLASAPGSRAPPPAE